MRRRIFTRTCMLKITLTTLIFSLNAGHSRGQAVENLPNILVLIADDHSRADSEPYGSKEVKTPFLKKLADEGLRFDRAFVNSPSCAPSRAALLTGMTPPHNGAEPNHSKPRKELAKLPGLLKSLGYEVVAFGKVSHYQHTGDYGFDHFAFDSYQDHRGIAAAREWLEKRAANKDEKRPLALFVGSNWPHVPWPPASGYNAENVNIPANHLNTIEYRQARAKYLTAVTLMDEELGSVHETAMKTLGRDKTFVLFTSDHGAQLPFGKWNLYDDGIRVPLIVKWPGVVKPSTSTAAMAQWMDILPTLIEIGGGKPGAGMDGRSFLGVLKNPGLKHHDAIFTTHSADGNMNVYPMRSVRTEKYKLIWNLRTGFQFTTHIDRSPELPGRNYWNSWKKLAETNETARATLARYHVRPEFELYNIETDPFEMINLAADPKYADQVSEMKTRLEAWMKQQGDTKKVYGVPLGVGEPILPPRLTPAKKKAAAKKME